MKDIKILVENIKELKNGEAILTLRMNKEAQRMLIEYGFMRIIENTIGEGL